MYYFLGSVFCHSVSDTRGSTVEFFEALLNFFSLSLFLSDSLSVDRLIVFFVSGELPTDPLNPSSEWPLDLPQSIPTKLLFYVCTVLTSCFPSECPLYCIVNICCQVLIYHITPLLKILRGQLINFRINSKLNLKLDPVVYSRNILLHILPAKTLHS